MKVFREIANNDRNRYINLYNYRLSCIYIYINIYPVPKSCSDRIHGRSRSRFATQSSAVFFPPVMDHTLGLWELDSSTPESKHGLNVQTVCLVRHVRHQGA